MTYRATIIIRDKDLLVVSRIIAAFVGFMFRSAPTPPLRCPSCPLSCVRKGRISPKKKVRMKAKIS